MSKKIGLWRWRFGNPTSTGATDSPLAKLAPAAPEPCAPESTKGDAGASLPSEPFEDTRPAFLNANGDLEDRA
jgi:hypothetical protein